MTDNIGDIISGYGLRRAPEGTPKEHIERSWLDYFNHPATQAALLQTGTMLMQPIGIGQNLGGHLAQSLQGGLAAAGRVAANEQAAQTAAAERARLEQQTDYLAKQAEFEAQRPALERESLDIRRQAMEADKQFQAERLRQMALDRAVDLQRIKAMGGGSDGPERDPAFTSVYNQMFKPFSDRFALTGDPAEIEKGALAAKVYALRALGRPVPAEDQAAFDALIKGSQPQQQQPASPTKKQLSDERINARVQEFVRFYKSKHDGQEPPAELIEQARERARAERP